jgi:DNA-binding NarL/FixJ family response regulator
VTISVVVVDDHRAFLDAVRARLETEPDLRVVAAVVSSAEADRVLSDEAVDVVVVDVHLAGEDGIAYARRLRTENPGVRVVVLSGNDDPDLATAAVRAGASAFLVKASGVEQLLGAVRGVMRGETWITPRLLTDVIIDLTEPRRRPGPEERLATLTEREREVLLLLTEGLDRAAIAKRLYVSVNTVRSHMANLFAKLGVHSSVEAVGIATRAGLAGEAVSGESPSPR